MKKLILNFVVLVATAVSSQATLILSNSFGYTDGPLITVSAGSPLGVWTTHSGTAAQVDVAGGKVNVTQAESEDVNTVITNATFPKPFTNETLYAGFTVNFSGLPSGAGTYFAHFKDSTISGFRCRVFAGTNGAAGGKYRLGIQNFSTVSPQFVPTDLDLGTDYKVVVRFVGSTNSTIWINPISEGSTGNRAVAIDTGLNTYNGTYSYALRQSLSSGDGMGTLTFDDLLIGTSFGDVTTVGGNPIISGIPNQEIAANSSTAPISFTVDDVETAATNLTVSGTSTNTTLVPNNPANITFGGGGNNRTVTITPAAGQEGVTLITVVVTDGDMLSASNSFLLTVGAPSISAIADQTTATNTSTAAIAFTVYDAETPGSLTVAKSSSNPALVQDANIVINNLGGSNRTVTITPEPNQAGQTTITLTVNDGTQTATTSFVLTVYPKLGLLLVDDFTYPDGFLPSVSGGFWFAHSGADSNDLLVVSGTARLTRTNSTDCSAFFSNSVSIGATSGGILYSKFTVNFAALPTGNGGYFAHYRDTGTVNFRARVFAETNGAAPGFFRIGIANGGFAVAAVPIDLSLNTTYVVVTRYNVGSASSTIWVNPASESSPSATATDPTNPVDIWSFALRQDGSSGQIGALFLDDLKVGTLFSDVYTPVVPQAIPLSIERIGNDLVLSWSNPAFSLQAAPQVTGVYTNVTGATSPFTNTISGSQLYFRLKY